MVPRVYAAESYHFLKKNQGVFFGCLGGSEKTHQFLYRLELTPPPRMAGFSSGSANLSMFEEPTPGITFMTGPPTLPPEIAGVPYDQGL